MSKISRILSVTFIIVILLSFVFLKNSDKKSRAEEKNSLTVTVPQSPHLRTFYVDFDNGSDNNTGMSPQSPFKHCPGDDKAEGTAGSTVLQPGDWVIFKGGVHYRGTVNIPFSGKEGTPIVYDGNSEGKFGTGRAVIQGAEPVTGWKKVDSPSDVEENPHYGNLFYAYVDDDKRFFRFSLYEGERYLNCAQDPDPEIPFYHDRPETYLPREGGRISVTPASIVDAGYFTPQDKTFYDGAYAAVWVSPNAIVYQRIRSYDPETHKITFDRIKNRLYSDEKTRYSIMNSLKFLDKPGEYYLDEKNAKNGKVRLVLWPYGTEAGGPQNVTISTRRRGIVIENAGYVTINGFKIFQQGGDRAAGIYRIDEQRRVINGITISNCEISRVRTYPRRSGAIYMNGVSNSLIERNHIHENAYCAGMIVTQLNNSIVQYNLLRKNGSTAVDFYDCHHSKLLYNIVRDNLGMHANGLTMYLGCTDILVEGNETYNANGVTTNEGDNITIRNNIFVPRDRTAMGLWRSKPLTNLKIYNNICLGSMYIGNKGTGWIIKNNVIGGIGGVIQPDAQVSHNVYTELGGAQKGNEKMREGEKVIDSLRELFADPDNNDFRPKPGSPLIDAGCDAGVDRDFVGTKRPQGRAVDIGAYEYVPDGRQYPENHVEKLINK